MGGFCVLKRRNFEFAKGLFRGEKREKNRPVLEAQTNAQLSKREVKREIEEVCFFCFCAPPEHTTL